MQQGFSKTTKWLLVSLTSVLVAMTCVSLVVAFVLLVFLNNNSGYPLVALAVGADLLLITLGRFLKKTILKKLFLR